jgi:hypothetical protein
MPGLQALRVVAENATPWWMLGTTIIDVASIDTDCSSPERAH